MFPALVVVATIVVLIVLSRAGELFLVSVRDGEVLLVRGRLPQGLLNDFADIVAAPPPVRRATIRASRAPGGVRLGVSGDLDESRAQRLRNALGLRPMSALRSAPIDEERTLGQVLGIAWLAWMLHRSKGG